MPSRSNGHRAGGKDAPPEAMEEAHDPRSAPDDPRSTPDALAGRSTTHAHAHAHADDPPSPIDAYDGDSSDQFSAGPFPHERLDAYRVALKMAALAKKLATAIPRGHRNVADHMERRASNTVLLFAEGANPRGPALERQRFVESRGEAGEVAAAADLVLVLELGPPADAKPLERYASRVSAMLTRLIARLP